MVENYRFQVSSEFAKKNDFDDYAFRCAAPYPIDLQWGEPHLFSIGVSDFPLTVANPIPNDFANLLNLIFYNNSENYGKTVFLDGVSPSLAGVSPI